MCDVCCEEFNASTRSRVVCPYCPFNACSGCVEKYLLDTSEDPHCMSCRKAWSREILCGNLTAKFVTKTLKARREIVLFERERSLMPATQPYVEVEKNVRHMNSLISSVRTDIGKLRQKQVGIGATPSAVFTVQANLTNQMDGRIERNRQFYEIEKQIKALETDVAFYISCISIYTRDGATAVERKQFVRACPSIGCQGFLSTAWKCGLCENWACPECHESKGKHKDGPHTCNPDNVATARLLEKDSRPCPKCASIIFKIDGCDQMWCTQCHTAFSWRRGTIEAGGIHNPHYYDYMRARGNLPRAPGDVPCGGLPAWSAVVRVFSHPVLGTIHRTYGHIQHVVLTRYIVNVVEDNRDLRIKFMIRDFTDEVFKKKLQQREKARQKKTEIRQILEMYQTVTIDLFQTLIQNKDWETTLHEFHELKTHTNEELRKVSKRFTNCAVPLIRDDFQVY